MCLNQFKFKICTQNWKYLFGKHEKSEKSNKIINKAAIVMKFSTKATTNLSVHSNCIV